MIAAEETKAKEAPSNSSVSKGANTAPPADYETDPIDYTTAHRMKAGGLTSQKSKLEVTKDKLTTAPALNLTLANEKATF